MFLARVIYMREFAEECQQRRGLSEPLRQQKRYECGDFPVLSLIIREFDARAVRIRLRHPPTKNSDAAPLKDGIAAYLVLSCGAMAAPPRLRRCSERSR